MERNGEICPANVDQKSKNPHQIELLTYHYQYWSDKVREREHEGRSTARERGRETVKRD